MPRWIAKWAFDVLLDRLNLVMRQRHKNSNLHDSGRSARLFDFDDIDMFAKGIFSGNSRPSSHNWKPSVSCLRSIPTGFRAEA